MNKIGNLFWRYEGPTLLVATAIFAGWFALVLYHENLSWPVLFVCGGIVAAWHSSLVHESVHNLKTIPKWAKMTLVLPPLAVWFPYGWYARAHAIHHRDANLTVPGVDPESYYFTREDWDSRKPWVRSLYMFNQTFFGRMTVGPGLTLWHLSDDLIRKCRAGDERTIRSVCVHMVSLALMFWFIAAVADMPWWLYMVCFALPGLSLGLIRSFCEHGAEVDPDHRTAIIESGLFFNLLFLYNNLHVVHHLDPKMRWYDIPAYYRAHREELHERNGGYVFSGYGEVVRRFFLTPAFAPVHPSE